jgi:hypothetical protein
VAVASVAAVAPLLWMLARRGRWQARVPSFASDLRSGLLWVFVTIVQAELAIVPANASEPRGAQKTRAPLDTRSNGHVLQQTGAQD